MFVAMKNDSSLRPCNVLLAEEFYQEMNQFQRKTFSVVL